MTTPTREQVIAATLDAYSAEDRAFFAFWYAHMKDDLMQAPLHAVEHSVARLIFTAGRDQGLREAKEAFSVSEHMQARNTGLMLCISDLSAVIVRMAAGIDHLSETARQWEPDHSSGADRRGWVLATEARDDALKLLKEHAAAIEQLRGK